MIDLLVSALIVLGAVVALLGSIAFMAANIAFLIPFYRRSSSKDRED